MSAKLIEWISRLAPVSGDARRSLVRAAQSHAWDLRDFERHVVNARSFPRPLADALTPQELAVLQRVWRSDFKDGNWQRGTFDFLCDNPYHGPGPHFSAADYAPVEERVEYGPGWERAEYYSPRRERVEYGPARPRPDYGSPRRRADYGSIGRRWECDSGPIIDDTGRRAAGVDRVYDGYHPRLDDYSYPSPGYPGKYAYGGAADRLRSPPRPRSPHRLEHAPGYRYADRGTAFKYPTSPAMDEAHGAPAYPDDDHYLGPEPLRSPGHARGHAHAHEHVHFADEENLEDFLRYTQGPSTPSPMPSYQRPTTSSAHRRASSAPRPYTGKVRDGAVYARRGTMLGPAQKYTTSDFRRSHAAAGRPRSSDAYWRCRGEPQATPGMRPLYYH